MKRFERLGVDLDSKNRLKMLMAFFNAKKLGNVSVFETRHGYHLRIKYPRKTVEENLELRRFLGDDVRRIALDEVRAHNGDFQAVDTLFEGKLSRDGVFSLEIEINPLNEQFWGFGDSDEVRYYLRSLFCHSHNGFEGKPRKTFKTCLPAGMTVGQIGKTNEP